MFGEDGDENSKLVDTTKVDSELENNEANKRQQTLLKVAQLREKMNTAAFGMDASELIRNAKNPVPSPK